MVVSSSIPLWTFFVLLVTTTAVETTAPLLPPPATLDDVTHQSTMDAAGASAAAVKDARVERMLGWIRGLGGFVSSKVEIRHSADKGYGVFAKKDIQIGDLIFSIPPTGWISPSPGHDNWICDTTYELIEELKLGNASAYAPYIDFLLETQDHGHLPSHWSESGQELLLDITGGTMLGEDQLVPPFGPTAWIDDEWQFMCQGDMEDEFAQHAFLLVVHRGQNDVLVPLLDLLNHRNGYWLNTETTSTEQGEAVQVTATKLIMAGDELYTTYTHCLDCGERGMNTGTAEFVRDYGFVEEFPQRWIFEEFGISFLLDYKDYSTIDGRVQHSEELVVEWLSPEAPEDGVILYLEEQFNRIEDLVLDAAKIPQNEWDVIVQYHHAILQALEYALEFHQAKNQVCTASSDGQQVCKVASSRYDALETFDFEYHMTTCDTTKTQNFDDEYKDTEQFKSPYQVISFFEHPKTLDACFDLDDIYQICTSYRPHYHEMVVHYTARFLPEIKRVLWVGGGDSMLLHEILKYPSLEIVLGLELDQKVTRHSFKHFGTQPHWDNPKVQWWYGDAAKSLLMLPRQFFGSFDMVLVDLSETVMSAKVTGELDIMAALSLLLKPEGIFVKNELYFEKLSPIFKHTTQVHIYDFPVICSQALSLGSNTVDFVRGEITDHGVEAMFKQLDDLDRHRSIFHDYELNPSAQRYCKSEEANGMPVDQKASPGIVMILEAEDVTSDLERDISKDVTLALENEGLHVVSTSLSKTGSGSIVSFVMSEGYVIARTWPEAKYCAYDIHLWSSFEKLEQIKKALLEAVGSKSQSSFRIVAGGMFGVSTWKKDEMTRGPTFTEDCSAVVPSTPGAVATDASTIGTVLDASLSALAKPESVAVIVCGVDGVLCPSLEATKNIAIKDFLSLSSCPSIAGGVEFLENSTSLKFECEQNVVSTLEKFVSASGKINVMIVDPSAEYAMAQIIHTILSRRKVRNTYFNHDILVLSPVVRKEKWRTLFVKKFLELLPKEPAFYSEIIFNNSDTSVVMDSFISGNPFFVEKLAEVTKSIEQSTGLVGEVRNIRGGIFAFQDKFKPTQFFEPKDYDQSDPYRQWLSQRPTGYQTLFQMELANPKATLSKEKVLHVFTAALAQMKIDATPQEYADMGDGSVIVAVWSAGSAIVLFNGRSHVDLNWFTYEENKKSANLFLNKFTSRNDVSFKVILHDEMPRGYGRVVNFKQEVTEAFLLPRPWAKHLKNV